MSSSTDNDLQKNIVKIALSDFFYNFGLIWAIYLLYFRFLNYEFQEIGLFEAICSITIVLTELASGSLADIIGRRNTVILGNISMLILSLVLGLGSGGTLILIIAGIFNGLDFSFRSGARTALLYDTMIELNRADDFLKVSGRIHAFSLISKMLGMIIGSFLFLINPRIPYWIWSGFLIISIFILTFVKEPRTSPNQLKITELWQNMKSGVKFIFKNKALLWFTAFFLLVDVFAESYWDIYSQEHLIDLGLTTKWIGIIFAILTGFSSIASYYIADIEKRLGEKLMLFLIIGVQGTLFFVMIIIKDWYWILIILFFLTIHRNFSWLLEENYRNKLIPSSMRAGVLSAASFLKNGLFGGWLIIWMFGLLIDSIGIRYVLLISALVVLTFGFGMILLRKNKKNID
ncbi:MAG: MFS transporter [Promethearchaeota archaeon]